MWRQRLCEHCGVEFVGLAIRIEKGARETRVKQWRAEADGAAEQLFDKAVFASTQRQGIKVRRSDERRRVMPSAVR